VARALTPALERFAELPAPHGWGLGYEQESQILLRKSPQGAARISLARLASELRTRALVALIEPQRHGLARTTENLSPYRWRGWLFGLFGSLPPLRSARAEVLGALPDFLRRNVQGDSAQELLFHRFLGRLRADGIELQSLWVPLEASLRALRAVLLEVEAEAEAPLELALAVSDGRSLIALSAGTPLVSYQIHGQHQMPGREQRPEVSRAARDVRIHAVMVAEGAPGEGWEALPPRVLWSVDAEGAVSQLPLEG
jgi:hypothetical protein